MSTIEYMLGACFPTLQKLALAPIIQGDEEDFSVDSLPVEDPSSSGPALARLENIRMEHVNFEDEDGEHIELSDARYQRRLYIFYLTILRRCCTTLQTLYVDMQQNAIAYDDPSLVLSQPAAHWNPNLMPEFPELQYLSVSWHWLEYAPARSCLFDKAPASLKSLTVVTGKLYWPGMGLQDFLDRFTELQELHCKWKAAGTGPMTLAEQRSQDELLRSWSSSLRRISFPTLFLRDFYVAFDKQGGFPALELCEFRNQSIRKSPRNFPAPCAASEQKRCASAYGKSTRSK